MYIFEETVLYFTQYVKKMREKSLVWKYKLLVIESWAKESSGPEVQTIKIYIGSNKGRYMCSQFNSQA